MWLYNTHSNQIKLFSLQGQEVKKNQSIRNTSKIIEKGHYAKAQRNPYFNLKKFCSLSVFNMLTETMFNKHSGCTYYTLNISIKKSTQFNINL